MCTIFSQSLNVIVMQTLHSELASMDQDNVDTNTFQGVRKELISTTILLHKDKGVRALAACCIADLLRLYAPDAPYTAPELKVSHLVKLGQRP
jgi:sister-chromatid-cohesion protein PDS5